MTRRQRLLNLAVAVVIAVVAVVVILATNGGDEPEREAAATPSPTVPTEPRGTATPKPRPSPEPIPAIEVRGGEVVGGVEELRFEEGDRVRFEVTADVAEHVHVHAYDIFKDVAPGQTVRFDFPATITGITEVELEDSGLQIAELRVEP